MTVTLSDKALDLAADGSTVPVAGAPVSLAPTHTPVFYSVGGVYRPLDDADLAVTSAADGSWSIVVPTLDQVSDPTLQWQLTLPDGAIYAGSLPAGISGQTLSVEDLIASHGWGLVAGGSQDPISIVSIPLKIAGQVTVAAASVTFTAIPQTFTHLRLIAEFAIAASFHLRLWINGDANDANYNTTGWQSYAGYGGGPGSGSTGNTATAIFDQGGGAADQYALEILIPLYTDAARAGSALFKAGQYSSGAAPGIAQSAGAIAWTGAQPITQLQLASSGGTLTGTATLYGVQ